MRYIPMSEQYVVDEGRRREPAAAQGYVGEEWKRCFSTSPKQKSSTTDSTGMENIAQRQKGFTSRTVNPGCTGSGTISTADGKSDGTAWTIFQGLKLDRLGSLRRLCSTSSVSSLLFGQVARCRRSGGTPTYQRATTEEG